MNWRVFTSCLNLTLKSRFGGSFLLLWYTFCMTHWLSIALIAPFLWAIVNHADKYLLSKYFKNKGGVGPLMIFSTLFGAIVLPIVFYIEPKVFAISAHDVLILIVAGVLSAVAIALYLFALEVEEASVVVPFWQTIPVFGYIIGYFLFDEVFTGKQLLAGLAILLGALILVIDFQPLGKFKTKIAGLMLLSSLIFASYEAMFRYVALEENFWVSVFWEHIGLVIVGIILLVCFKTYRRGFLDILKSNSGPIISLNIGSEALTIVGNIIMNYALLLAPLAMVLLISSYQPVFVFLIGVALTFLLPKIHTEKMGKVELVQKIIAIAIMCIGSYYLG